MRERVVNLYVWGYVCRHRLKYSHSWGLPHECIRIGIRIHVKIFVFFFFYKIKIKIKNCFFLWEQVSSEQQARKPVHVAYTLASLYILISAKKLGFRLKTLSSIIILILDRIFPFWPASSSPYANHTSYSRLKTQGFTETLTLTTTLII